MGRADSALSIRDGTIVGVLKMMTRNIISVLVLCLAMFLHVVAMGDDCAYAVEMEEMKVSIDEARKYGVEISKSGVTNGCLILNVKCLSDIRKSYDGAQKLLFTNLYSAKVYTGESVSHLAIPREGEEVSWQINLKTDQLPCCEVILRYGYDEQYVKLAVSLAGVLSPNAGNREAHPRMSGKEAGENAIVGLPGEKSKGNTNVSAKEQASRGGESVKPASPQDGSPQENIQKNGIMLDKSP